MRRRTRTRPAQHAPQRTCLACRKIRAKQELIRLVRTPDERVEIDIGGKKRGRGTYLCPTPECWQIGLKGNRLEHSLRVKLTQDNREQLIRFAAELAKK